MNADRSISKRRDIASLVVALSGLGAVALAGYVAIFAGLHCSGGDGGVPYVAGDSAQAGVCSATGDGVLLTLALLAVSLALLIFVYRLGRAWASRHRGPLAFLALAFFVAVLPAGTGLALAPFSSECSPEKEAAWSEYNRTGEDEGADLECASY